MSVLFFPLVFSNDGGWYRILNASTSVPAQSNMGPQSSIKEALPKAKFYRANCGGWIEEVSLD